MKDFFEFNPAANATFYDKYKHYDFVDGVPKQLLFINLKAGISAQDREFVGNGVRSLFKSQLCLFVDTVAQINNL